MSKVSGFMESYKMRLLESLLISERFAFAKVISAILPFSAMPTKAEPPPVIIKSKAFWLNSENDKSTLVISNCLIVRNVKSRNLAPRQFKSLFPRGILSLGHGIYFL